MTSDVEPRWPPSPLHVAVDLVALTLIDDTMCVLLLRRPYQPFEGSWALPGTFSDPNETLEETAHRALASKGGVAARHVEQLATYDLPARGDAPGRDPRGRVVSVAWLCLIVDGGGLAESAGLGWFPVEDTPEPLAFDHARILSDGVERLRAKARYSTLPFALLGEPFTLGEIQRVYEVVLREELDVRNFRRDLLGSAAVEETGVTKVDGPGRPARLYRLASDAFAVDAEERRLAQQISRPE